MRHSGDMLQTVAEVAPLVKKGEWRAIVAAEKGMQMAQLIGPRQRARFGCGQPVQQRRAETLPPQHRSHAGQSIRQGALGRQVKILDRRLNEQNVGPGPIVDGSAAHVSSSWK